MQILAYQTVHRILLNKERKTPWIFVDWQWQSMSQIELTSRSEDEKREIAREVAGQKQRLKEEGNNNRGKRPRNSSSADNNPFRD